jgi:hypothetical protein
MVNAWLPPTRSRAVAHIRKSAHSAIAPASTSPRAASLLEKKIGCRFRRTLAHHIGFEAGDLLLEKRHALSEFADRQQSQVLANLVGDLFLRPVFIVDGWHGWTPGIGRKITATGMVVTSALAD